MMFIGLMDPYSTINSAQKVSRSEKPVKKKEVDGKILFSWGILLTGLMLIVLTVVLMYGKSERRVFKCGDSSEIKNGCDLDVHFGFSSEHTSLEKSSITKSEIVKISSSGEIIGGGMEMIKNYHGTGGRRVYTVVMSLGEEEEQIFLTSWRLKRTMAAKENDAINRFLLSSFSSKGGLCLCI